MLRFLYTTSKSFMDGLAVRMFQYSNYALISPVNATV